MKKENEDVVSVQELLVANSVEIDALVQVLVRKGLITEAKLLGEIREMEQRKHAEGKSGAA